jgi:hypothetical protein
MDNTCPEEDNIKQEVMEGEQQLDQHSWRLLLLCSHAAFCDTADS